MRATIARRLATPVSDSAAASIAKRSTQSTASPTPKPRTTRVKTANRKPSLSLEHFLLRSRVISLYRTIVRAIYQIPDKGARRDPVAHAKGEFSRNKDVTDTEQIRYLVSTGKAEWDGMRRYVDEMAMRAGK